MSDPFDEIEALVLGIAPSNKKPLPARPLVEVKQIESTEENTPLVKLFQEKNIRIRGTIERLLICGADVGVYIGDRNYNRIIAKYSPGKYMEMVSATDAKGRRCQIMYLTEAGLYKYLLQSKREEAEAFQDFAFDLLTAERKRTVDSIQLALKISQTELEEKCRENASMSRKQSELYTAVNDARESATKLKKANATLIRQKHAAADAEEMRLCGRQVEQILGWNC